MQNSNFIDARRFTFAPFPHPLHPDVTGDSGALEFAVSKKAPDEQYIVKCGGEYPEVAANEFMYHKVADALGLYTQDVFLIDGSHDYRRSAAIRYVPNAKLFGLENSSEENFSAFFEFEALYVILNEGDSHEYYIDGDGRLFKLDNADSFTVEQATVLRFDGNPIGRFFIPDINAPLNSVGYDYYGNMYQAYSRKYGKEAGHAYLTTIHRFADIDQSLLDEAYTDLEKQYPLALCRYYDEAIRIRRNTCRKFLVEIGGVK
jgi:hypothetical protein